MIERPTVLVLGAGASEPYLFPSGIRLVEQAIKMVDGEYRTRLVAEAAQINPADVATFTRALRDSGTRSIDLFLEGRPEFIAIGKLVIATLLIPWENVNRLFDRKLVGAWYDELLSRMGGTPYEFSRNNLSIVTFNYDRSLETYLLVALQNRFNLTRARAIDLLSRYPVVHLHGQLGELPGLEKSGAVREFDPTVTVENIRTAASAIKVIHEDVVNTAEFKEAHRLIRDADDVIFLGFGYHPTNLSRLNLQARTKPLPIRGTGFGMEEAELEMVKELMKELAAGIPFWIKTDVDALTFLRRHWVTRLVPRGAD